MPSYTDLPRPILALHYQAAAEAYCRSLPLEHFMEAIGQSTQRKITVQSLDLVQLERPDVQTFSELLVQAPLSRRKLLQIVPDNLVVVWDKPIKVRSSFNLPLQPVGPFWVMEYVSKESERKDYEKSFAKYERQLKVPYYLTFYPDEQELILYRLRGKRYVTVKPNEHGRYAVPDLEIEVAILDSWVRFWFRGRLLPLTADLQRELNEAQRRIEDEKRRADDEKRRADDEKRRADDEKRRADDEKRRADDEKRRADELQQRLQAAQEELARLQAQQGRSPGGPAPPPPASHSTRPSK